MAQIQRSAANEDGGQARGELGGGGCEERKADRPYLLYSGEKSSEPAQRFARLLGKGAITNTAAFVGIGGKSNVEKDKVVDSQ